MRVLTLAIAAVATLASATLASASDRVSDSEYLKAARCTGLAQGANQGAQGFEAYLKAQGKGRQSAIADRAERIRDKARHAASIANDTQKGVFSEELSGACAAYAS